MPDDFSLFEPIWARRAAELAQPQQEPETGELIDLVVVQTGGEVFGLETGHVIEVWHTPRLTPLPRLPRWLAGLANLRGRILTVVDLGLFLGLPAVATPPAETYLVVAGSGHLRIGLRVDSVLAVTGLPLAELQPLTHLVHNLPTTYLRGAAPLPANLAEPAPAAQGEALAGPAAVHSPLLLVLDLPALLNTEALVIDEGGANE